MTNTIERQAEHLPETFAELKVLVVDDDPFINRLVQIRLKKRGLMVSSVGDGRAALDAIFNDKPDLVFLDVSMPQVSGLEVLEQVRRAKTDVAVIMMTAFGSESIAVEAMRYGADDYLPKPFEPVDFEAVLERTVRRLLLTRQNAMLRRRLEMEMAQATQVQADLLPQTVPQLPGFEMAAHFQPARSVSGDFYDWYVAEDGKLIFTLGDVMGKGMPAALLMATVRATMRAAGRNHQPAETLAISSAVMGPDLERSGRFVTLFHACLDPVSATLTYADAGHGLGFVQHVDGTCTPLVAQGLPLGIFLDTTYQAATLNLARGELLVLHSDGLLDAKGDGAFLETDLMGSIPPGMCADEARRTLLDFAVPSGDLPDDLTLLVLRRMP